MHNTACRFSALVILNTLFLLCIHGQNDRMARFKQMSERIDKEQLAQPFKLDIYGTNTQPFAWRKSKRIWMKPILPG